MIYFFWCVKKYENILGLNKKTLTLKKLTSCDTL